MSINNKQNQTTAEDVHNTKKQQIMLQQNDDH
jgi:hypothetical protein